MKSLGLKGKVSSIVIEPFVDLGLAELQTISDSCDVCLVPFWLFQVLIFENVLFFLAKATSSLLASRCGI